jgi:hypothetical protein
MIGTVILYLGGIARRSGRRAALACVFAQDTKCAAGQDKILHFADSSIRRLLGQLLLFLVISQW